MFMAPTYIDHGSDRRGALALFRSRSVFGRGLRRGIYSINEESLVHIDDECDRLWIMVVEG